MGNVQTVVPYAGEVVTWTQFTDFNNPQYLVPPANFPGDTITGKVTFKASSFKGGKVDCKIRSQRLTREGATYWCESGGSGVLNWAIKLPKFNASNEDLDNLNPEFFLRGEPTVEAKQVTFKGSVLPGTVWAVEQSFDYFVSPKRRTCDDLCSGKRNSVGKFKKEDCSCCGVTDRRGNVDTETCHPHIKYFTPNEETGCEYHRDEVIQASAVLNYDWRAAYPPAEEDEGDDSELVAAGKSVENWSDLPKQYKYEGWISFDKENRDLLRRGRFTCEAYTGLTDEFEGPRDSANVRSAKYVKDASCDEKSDDKGRVKVRATFLRISEAEYNMPDSDDRKLFVQFFLRFRLDKNIDNDVDEIEFLTSWDEGDGTNEYTSDGAISNEDGSEVEVDIGPTYKTCEYLCANPDEKRSGFQVSDCACCSSKKGGKQQPCCARRS